MAIASAPHGGAGRIGMECIGCGLKTVTERPERTAHSYRRFCCRTCGMQFIQHFSMVLNRAQYLSDVIALVVLWCLPLLMRAHMQSEDH